MTVTALLVTPSTPLTLFNKTLHSHSLLSPKKQPFLFKSKPRGRPVTIAKSKGDVSADAPDKLTSAICYFYPFFDGIQYGKSFNPRDGSGFGFDDEFGQHRVFVPFRVFDLWVVFLLVWSAAQIANCC
ncbi:hypothetical protein SLA2020_058100 [Shorea laevis]